MDASHGICWSTWYGEALDDGSSQRRGERFRKTEEGTACSDCRSRLWRATGRQGVAAGPGPGDGDRQQQPPPVQTLLYQVATADLSPADISAPIRSILKHQNNTSVILAEVTGVDVQGQRVLMHERSVPYDYLIVATGAHHSYFGHDAWEPFAPGLKSIDDVAPVAMQEGCYVAQVIAQRVSGKKNIPPFRYHSRRNLATVGRSFAVVESGPLHLAGFLAWTMWLAVHIFYLIGFRNRLLVMFQWAWEYLTRQRSARLITCGDATEPSVW